MVGPTSRSLSQEEEWSRVALLTPGGRPPAEARLEAFAALGMMSDALLRFMEPYVWWLRMSAFLDGNGTISGQDRRWTSQRSIKLRDQAQGLNVVAEAVGLWAARGDGRLGYGDRALSTNPQLVA